MEVKTDRYMTKSMHPKRQSVRWTEEMHERGETP